MRNVYRWDPARTPTLDSPAPSGKVGLSILVAERFTVISRWMGCHDSEMLMASRDADLMEVWEWPITTRGPRWRSADIPRPDVGFAWLLLPLNTVQRAKTLRIEAAERRVRSGGTVKYILRNMCYLIDLGPLLTSTKGILAVVKGRLPTSPDFPRRPGSGTARRLAPSSDGGKARRIVRAGGLGQRSGGHRHRRHQSHPLGPAGELAVVERGHAIAVPVAGVVQGIR